FIRAFLFLLFLLYNQRLLFFLDVGIIKLSFPVEAMQSELSGILSRIPAAVIGTILADESCKTVWFFNPKSREVISMDALRSLPNPPSNSGADATERHLVYGMMRVRNQGVMFERDHIQRLYENCVLAATSKPLTDEATLPFPVEGVTQSIREYILSEHKESGDINLKFVTWLPPFSNSLTTAEAWQKFLSDFSYVVYFVKSFFPPKEWYTEGIRISLLYNARRHTPNAKIIQAPLRSRAKSLQDSSGAFEVFFVWDKEAHFLVPEGSRSNYLLVTEDGHLCCSLQKDILRGITLHTVKRVASTTGLADIEQRPIYVGDLCLAKAIAMLGTSPGVLPVREIQFYYDEESKANFISALDDYEQCMKEKGECPSLPRETILSNGGRLELDSPHNTMLAQLREAYEAEAFR
ncbi:protein G6, partial [Trypanosoma cruzi]